LRVADCAIQTDYDEDFLGVPMYWRFFDAETNGRLVQKARLRMLANVGHWTAGEPDSSGRESILAAIEVHLVELLR
jgi:hypothetical protein